MARASGLRVLLVVLAVAAVVGVTVLIARPDSTTGGEPVAATRSFLFLGDSLSANFYATTAEDGYRELVVMDTHGREAAFIGGPGRTVGEVLGELPGAGDTGADTIVVELGSNDLLGHLPLPRVQASYEALIDAARERAAPGASVYCLGLWSDPAVTPAFATYEGTLQRVCTQNRGQWVSLTDLFANPANHGPGGTPTAQGTRDVFHPNDAGHRAIAERLVAAINAGRP